MKPGIKPPKYVIRKTADALLAEVNNVFSFIRLFFKEVFTPLYESAQVIRHCYNLGYRSLALNSLSAFITGIVFTKQSRPSIL